MPQLFLALMFQPNTHEANKRSSETTFWHQTVAHFVTLLLGPQQRTGEIFSLKRQLRVLGQGYLTCCRQNQMTDFISRQICLHKDYLCDHVCFPFFQQRKELHQVRCAPLLQINMLQHVTLYNAPGLQTGVELQALKWFKTRRIIFT